MQDNLLIPEPQPSFLAQMLGELKKDERLLGVAIASRMGFHPISTTGY
ncbi:hypothetical protein [Nostoc parmelioides]|uniref:Uncharacterized protein n=1 Tax=Nostoc parmelioides FACHB-3921 TaxID=2692909 RepID=A0ABR8BEN7_9NOSO|nr:hypothetical protein [Nostoc parmelioides]MBD2252410.1 hypothetical protein [Nostoc parmelioides FACHB-3921]